MVVLTIIIAKFFLAAGLLALNVGDKVSSNVMVVVLVLFVSCLVCGRGA